MNELEIIKDLNKWILEFVSVPNKSLNNWPPCPFARQTLLSNLVDINFHKNEALDLFLLSNLYKLSKFDVIIYCLDPDIVSYNELSTTVETLNEKLKTFDYVLLEDHPYHIENLNGIIMNFGKCTLVLAQKLSKLNNASNELKNKGYYKNWSDANLENIVNWRNK